MNVLSDPAVRLVIAHRGTSAHFPENTAAAFDHAVSLGVDAIEFDLRISRDGAVVVIHDPTVDRTTDGTGAVAELSLAELKRLDAGARFTRDGRTFPWRGQGLR
ncbi:MAG TPA: glycerophosphodiester phosphodiesterase family protein, partial [Gemmatimonadaceae bacterium]|nr:glycerophosphodiester phosphodiesterase family protein [Gemmatimonadaceae bacterium]